jgi:hypothetical protein
MEKTCFLQRVAGTFLAFAESKYTGFLRKKPRRLRSQVEGLRQRSLQEGLCVVCFL